MKKAMANKWKGIVFFTLLFSFLLLAGSRPVSAATTSTQKCRVVFADSNIRQEDV